MDDIGTFLFFSRYGYNWKWLNFPASFLLLRICNSKLRRLVTQTKNVLSYPFLLDNITLKVLILITFKI